MVLSSSAIGRSPFGDSRFSPRTAMIKNAPPFEASGASHKEEKATIGPLHNAHQLYSMIEVRLISLFW